MNRNRSLFVVALITIVAVLVGACGGDDGSGVDGAGDLSIIASFYPLAEAASRIGGDVVDVANLTPAGTEPHDLELTTDQVDDLEDADVVVYLGADFQPAVADIAARRDGVSLDLWAELELGTDDGHADDSAIEGDELAGDADHDAMDEVESSGTDDDHEHEHGTENGDPHFWLDPTQMIEAVDLLEAALVEASPEHATTFASNADAFRRELTSLDEEMEAGLDNCARRELVTSHAAFGHLARRYDLTQLAISGLSPEAEPDAARLDELVDEIEAHGITTVFYERLVDDDVAATLAREAGVSTAVLDPLEGLTQQQLDAGADYLGVMRDNLRALRTALDCS